MKKLILQSLTLENFKGQTFKLQAYGKNADIFGDNATGKTTLYDALCWLLFGKDSSFKSDFEIKNLNTDGTCEHNLCHEVRGLFRWDGKVVELRKIYAEIWTKKRGSASKEFTGHTTDHSIDSVPASKKEYQDYISTIATEEQFKLLTSPFFFSEKMKWQERRALLMSLVSDITDEHVIACDKKLAPLSAILSGRKLDDHKKVIAAKRREINDQLEKIPVRIDEVVKGMPDVSDVIVIEEQDKIKDWSVELETIDANIAGLKNNGALLELQKDLATAEANLIKATNTVTEKHNADRAAAQEKLSGIRSKLAGIDATIKNHEFDVVRREDEKNFLEKNLKTLREEYFGMTAQDREFKDALSAGSICCTTCGQNLPSDKVSEIIANHNEKLSEGKPQISGSESRKKHRWMTLMPRL